MAQEHILYVPNFLRSINLVGFPIYLIERIKQEEEASRVLRVFAPVGGGLHGPTAHVLLAVICASDAKNGAL